MNTNNSGLVKFIRGFGYAFEGIIYAARYERNMRFHIGAAALVIYLMRFFDLTAAESSEIYICIGIVTALELVNTAIESAIDMAAEDFHPLAKAAKDCAAAAVLVAAVASVAVAVKLLWKPSVWQAFIAYHINRPITGLIFAALILIWLVLVIKTPSKPDSAKEIRYKHKG